MKAIALAFVAGVAALAGGCTTTRTAPVDVTRFHLGRPVDRGTFATEPVRTLAIVSPEYQTYADAVSRELTQLGFSAADAAASQYIASVSFVRATRGFVEKAPPVSIGLGGGGGGFGRRSGVGLGGGVNFGLGGGQREVIGSELSVQIRRRSDGTVLWEGRAVTDALENTPAGQPIVAADRLAAALFKGFPGESGITTTVP